MRGEASIFGLRQTLYAHTPQITEFRCEHGAAVRPALWPTHPCMAALYCILAAASSRHYAVHTTTSTRLWASQRRVHT